MKHAKLSKIHRIFGALKHKVFGVLENYVFGTEETTFLTASQSQIVIAIEHETFETSFRCHEAKHAKLRFAAAKIFDFCKLRTAFENFTIFDACEKFHFSLLRN